MPGTAIGAVCEGVVVVGSDGIGMTCDPYKGLLLLLPGAASLICTSGSEPAEVVLTLCGRLFRPFLLRPSLAPIFFHPLLCALIARWRLLGDVLNAQSDVGGVVGGVMGSLPDGDPVLPVSSDNPVSRSTGSPEADPDRLWSLVHERLRSGKKPTFGDFVDSSGLDRDEDSFGMRSLRTCRKSWSSSISSGEGVATDARNGPNTESFMSS